MSNKKLKKWEFLTLALSIMLAIMAFILALHMIWCAVYSKTPQAIVSMVACVVNMTAFCLTESAYEAVSKELDSRNILCIYDVLFG